MEAMTRLMQAEDVVQQLNRLEELVKSDPRAALQGIGDQIAEWEGIVRHDSNFALAYRIGGLLESLRHYWLALSWYHWIADADEGLASRETITLALRAKGRMYIRLGMYREALHDLRQAEERLNQDGSSNPTDLPTVWQNMASLYDYLKQYDSALEYVTIALEAFTKLGDRQRASICKLMAGTYLYELKRFDAALTHLMEARTALEGLKDYFHLARCWHNYAELMRDCGRMEEAIAAWRMSLEMKKRNDDHVGQVNTLLSITEYLGAREDWHSAYRYATQAIALCHQYRLHDQEVTCLSHWSTVLSALGRDSELEVCAARAVFLLESVTGKDQVAALLQKIARDYHNKGREDLAKHYMDHAIQIIG